MSKPRVTMDKVTGVSSPHLGELLRHALRWAPRRTAWVVGVYFLAALLLPDPNEPLRFPGLLLGTVLVAVGGYAILVFGRMAWCSRQVMDRAFTWAGIAATFFGLAMLVVFFGQLLYEAGRWFQVMPRLVEQHNQQLLEDADQSTRVRKAQLERQMADAVAKAATEAEKARVRERFEKVIIPRALENEKLDAKEKRDDAERDVRHDTSPPALLAFFLTNGPSNQPQEAGIWPALLGSLWLGAITILFAVPVGVAAALYLEEYRSSSFLARLIQVNINNLAGVPSVVFGILGAYVFVELFFKGIEEHYPAVAARNVLGGGLTLGLLTLPVIIVAAQEAIRAVPQSIRHGAYALGATKWQVVWHHVLPLARPGILTGTILALSRAIGEAAPLILFGALLFVNQDPSLFSRFTILPMQIFGWADRPAVIVDGETVEIWRYNAAMASLVLLVMLLTLNAVAIVLRNRAQYKAKW